MVAVKKKKASHFLVIVSAPASSGPGFKRPEEGSEAFRDLGFRSRAPPEERGLGCRGAFDFCFGISWQARTFATGRDPVLIKQRGSAGSLAAQHLNTGNKTFLSF